MISRSKLRQAAKWVRDMTALAVRVLTAIFIYFFAWGTYAQADRRVALVIGNSEYETRLRLPNPSNDAQDMADSLRSLGFDVILRINADKQRFMQALAEFSRTVTGAEIGLFFYAGHGIQFNGNNYLMPVNAQLQDEVSIRFELVALEEVQRALDGSAGVRILVLDACRNNPLAAELTRSMRARNRDAAISRGLARIDQARGTVVAYSTQANEVAEDGAARNSPFTRALLDSLREPGLEIGAMFRKVATRVYEATSGKQVPELSISLLSEVFLNRNETDAQLWGRVRAANDLAGVRDFLDHFPNSFYAADARLRLDMLEREARAQQLDRERAERERELRDRMAALEIERLQAEMSLRAAERAAQDATERLRQEQAERERLAAEVIARQRAVAEVTEQLHEESARRSRISAEATGRERELRARLAELEQASRKATGDLALRARTSVEETTAKDQQIATIEQARHEAEARVAALTKQAQTLTAQIGSPVAAPPSRSEPQGQQVAAVNLDAPRSTRTGRPPRCVSPLRTLRHGRTELRYPPSRRPNCSRTSRPAVDVSACPVVDRASRRETDGVSPRHAPEPRCLTAMATACRAASRSPLAQPLPTAPDGRTGPNRSQLAIPGGAVASPSTVGNFANDRSGLTWGAKRSNAGTFQCSGRDIGS